MYLLLRGRLRPVLRNSEVRTFAVLSAVMVPLVLLLATSTRYPGAAKQGRVALFEVVSALTTTGCSTTTYAGWPAIGVFLLILLMLIGGGTGSTAGAIKQYRAHLLAKSMLWEARRMWSASRAVISRSVWQGDSETAVTDRGLVQVATFVVAYLVILATGTGVLVACGFSLQDSVFEYASALGTVGLSVGVTSAGAPTPALWAETVGMLLGRLEIFIVLIAIRKLLADGAALLRGLRR